jgi:beta-aspartyl-peptidase (threonine type)
VAIQPVLIVHGGAGDIADDRVEGKYDGMKAAVRQGYKVLLEEDDPLTAVEQAVNVMENLPDFNAGRAEL